MQEADPLIADTQAQDSMNFQEMSSNNLTPSPFTSSSSPPTLNTCSCNDGDKIAELESQVQFLQQSLKGLEDEVVELQQTLFNNAAIYEELWQAHGALQKDSNKQNQAYQTQLCSMEAKLKLSEQSSKLKVAKARKPYHELGPAQKKRVRREVREVIAPELNTLFNERSLACNRLVLEDVDGEKENVPIHITPHHKYDQLTPIERDAVQKFSDAKSINYVSDETYASFRRLNPEIPPLTHVKQNDQDVMKEIPLLEDAPGRSGGFLPLRYEAGQQIKFLVDKGDLTVGDDVAVKVGIDATKLSHKDSMCVYSLATITDSDSDIGVIGCVLGGDGHDDMKTCGTPFFKDLKGRIYIQADCFVQISTLINIKLLLGNKLSN